MNKYERATQDLEKTGSTSFKAFGNSMLPILKSGSKMYFERRDDYEVDDIVFSKVRGRYIDAHKIVAKNASKGFQIANNKGHINGWTKTIYGKVVKAELNGEVYYEKE